MRSVVVSLLSAVVLTPLLGCGGGLTQADMRRHAIRRSRGEEEDAAPAATASKGKQAALQEALEGAAPAQHPSKQAGPAGVPTPNTRHEHDRSAAANTESTHAATAVGTPAGPDAPAAAPSAAQQTDRVAPPTQALSLIQRRQRTLDNLAKIGEAVRRYTQEKKQVFASASYDAVGRPLLSWRVELLPYLGYEQLYREFALDQPWDSPNNRALLTQIPDVYQSPERCDEKTNYLVLKASYTPFSRRPPGMSLSSIEDGPADTVAVVEVDDGAAVPWTKPADMDLGLDQFRTQVGNLREDGFFVVWLDGAVGRIVRDCSVADLKAVFTCDAGDSFAAFAVRGAATATPAPVEAETVPEEDAAANTGRGAEKVASAEPARLEPAAERPATTSADRPARLPIPDPVRMEQARKLVRELYGEEYESQKGAQQRAVAQKMLKQAGEMENDPAGQYVLLDVALKIATGVGDTSTAISAAEKLAEGFTIDELEVMHDTLVALARKGRDQSGVSQVLAKSRGLIDRAIREEQFETAKSLCQVASAAARQLGDRDAASQLISQAAFVAECQKAFKEVQRILKSTQNSDDAEGNLRVGQYYCFIRGQWDKGLPLLAKGSDARLRDLAQAEMALPSLPADQLELADGWWELSTSDEARQVALHRRAAYWYRIALPALPTGLWRAKAEMRLQEYHRLHGALDVDASGMNF